MCEGEVRLEDMDVIKCFEIEVYIRVHCAAFFLAVLEVKYYTYYVLICSKNF